MGNSHYEKFPDGRVKCIDDEIPFEIPQGWEWARLGFIFAHNTGKALNSAQREGTLLRYITTSNLYWDRFELTEVREMFFSVSEVEKCTVTKGNLLICEGGDIGRAAIWDKDYNICIQNHIHRLRAYCNVCTRYFYYIFLLYKGIGNIGGKGIGIQGLSSGALHNILLPIPPLSEQGRISDKLDEVIVYVNKYEKSQERLDDFNESIKDRLRKSILQEAIQGRLVPQDPNDEPASVLLERIREEKQKLLKDGKLKKKDILDSVIFKGEDSKYYEKVGGKVLDISEEIPFEVPKSWQWCRLGYVICLQSGQDLTPDRYSDTPSGIPYITGASNFVDNTILVSRWTTTPTAIAHHGDLLITCKGTVGAMAYNNSGGDFHIARQIMAISSFEISLKYIELCIVFLLPQIEKEAHSIIPGISRDTILHSLIPIPPSNEQAAIVTRVKELYTRL